MALTVAKTRLNARPGDAQYELYKQFNNLCDLVRAWGVNLDADTLANSDYVSTLEAAVNKIGNMEGTAIS